MRAGTRRVRETRVRRWGVPPGLGTAETPFEGWGVLAEVDGAPGVALWQALRDAELWAGSAPGGERPFWSRAGAETGWAAELRELAEAAGGGAEACTRACLAVARAAGARGHPRTAAAFAETAARVLPADAPAALEAGRALHRAGEPRRAEAWLRRAVGLARRAGDRNSYGLACCAWGALLRERGEAGAAGERYALAARMARRHGLWRVKPLACWGLCALAAEAGRTAEATVQGRRALRSFGRRDPRLPLLALDLARAWSDAGHRAAALRVLRAAAEKLRASGERARLGAIIARVGAAPGEDRPTPRAIDALSVDLAEALSLREDDW